jgi:hypothetical protein
MAEIVSVAGEVIAQANTSSTWVDTPASSAVSESDAARLADLLSTQQTQAQAPGGVSPTPAPAVAQVSGVSAAGKNTMGDHILRSLDSVGRAYKEKAVELNKFLDADNPELSPMSLLRLQAQMLDQSIMVDVFSRGISKSVQEIDQLTKLQ